MPTWTSRNIVNGIIQKEPDELERNTLIAKMLNVLLETNSKLKRKLKMAKPTVAVDGVTGVAEACEPLACYRRPLQKPGWQSGKTCRMVVQSPVHSRIGDQKVPDCAPLHPGYAFYACCNSKIRNRTCT